LTIWELRNPFLSKLIIQKMCDFHHGCREAAQAIRPLDPKNLAVDVAINDWGTQAKAKLVEVRKTLMESETDCSYQLSVIDLLEQQIFFDGFQKYFSDLVPRENIVFSHNDV